MNAQFKKGVLELIVLAAVEQKDMYGYELVAEVSKVVNVKEGTIYPILKRLTNEHYFETYLRESTEGPPRKYYHLTAAGILHLRELEKEWEDMIEEYSQHISMCMKSGMKEEEAIEDFGDMDDLIAEILEAYHLDPEYEVKSRERSGKTGIADLLPKDFFKKKTKIAKAGNKSNVNDENNKSNPRKNRRVEGTKRFKEEQGRKIENITSKAVKTSSNAVSWSWDKIKKFFFIFIKIVLVFLALPAVFFDLAGLFGLGILGVMAFQGYPVIGCVIIAFGVVLSMTAYILFLFTYVLGGRGAKA